MDNDAKQQSRCQILRRILAAGASTCHEIAAETGLSLRRARVAVWVLTSQNHAKVAGRVPKEDGAKGHGHNLYELTPQGRAAFRRDARWQ
jgi:predicted ArsR family transcriptional regulator